MNRRYRRLPPASSLVFVVLLVIVALRLAWDANEVRNPSREVDVAAEGPPQAGLVEVVRVVDGDTLIVRPLDGQSLDNSDADSGSAHQRTYRVRLLGIDTPETVKNDHPVELGGPEATRFTKHAVRQGPVRLEFDKRRVDQYGRVLAYVYVGDEFLNLELVRNGLARVESYPGDSLAILRQLKNAEAEARSERRGIWNRSSANAEPVRQDR